MTNPTVSVVIATYNSARTLEACLRSVASQTYPHVEIIVVDNHSTDGTRTIAERFTDKFFIRGPERSAQRNYGVGQATGQYVALIDSDMKLSAEVIEQCITAISEHQGMAGVIIPEESFGDGFWVQCKKLERSFYGGVPWLEAARFFPVGTFKKLGGYNEALVSGEDWDLSQRAAGTGALSRVGACIYHDEGHLSLAGIMKKKYYYGRKFGAYIRQRHPQARTQVNPLRRYALFFRAPLRLLKNPLVAAGMLVLKMCEFLAGAAGYLISYGRQGNV